MVDEDVVVAVAVIARAELTDEGAQVAYEVRRGPADDDVLFVSLDVDESLAFLRGMLTGESPIT